MDKLELKDISVKNKNVILKKIFRDFKAYESFRESVSCILSNLTNRYVTFSFTNRITFQLSFLNETNNSVIYKVRFSKSNNARIKWSKKKQKFMNLENFFDVVKTVESKIKEAKVSMDIGSIFPYSIIIYTPKSPFKIRAISTKAKFLFVTYNQVEEIMKQVVKSENQLEMYSELVSKNIVDAYTPYIHKIAYHISTIIKSYVLPDKPILIPHMTYRKELFSIYSILFRNDFKIKQPASNSLSFFLKSITFQIVTLFRSSLTRLLDETYDIYYINEKLSSFDLLGYPLIKRNNSAMDRSRLVSLTTGEKSIIKVIDNNIASAINMMAFNETARKYMLEKLHNCYSPFDMITVYDYTKDIVRNIKVGKHAQEILQSVTLDNMNLKPLH